MAASVRVIKNEVRPFINKLIKKLKNPKPALNSLGLLEVTQTKLRFRREQDPQGVAWKPLNKATIKAKNSSVILTNKNILGGSIKKAVIDNKLFIGTNIQYGRFHQEGDGVPERQFLGVNEKTVRNAEKTMRLFLGIK